MKDKETGIQTESQEFKSAKQNLKAAFQKMVKKLQAHYASLNEQDCPRKQTADFSQRRVRTYNAVDDRVVDHQTGDAYSYKYTVGQGDISDLIEDRRKKMLTMMMERE